VRILPQQTVGEVIEITGGEAIVSFGSIMMRAKLEKLVNVGEEEFYQQVMIKKRGGENIFNELNTRMANFSVTLDVRGMRAEEAATAVIQYMDEALLLNIKEVKIIHGKGDGILRKVVRDNLRSIDEVIHIEDEHIERGGSGATVVRLK
jgi:DNA mismatch repair protein MutS2